MKKKSGKTLMQKWKNKIGGKLSTLNKKELVLTNIPYALAAFYADRAFFLYRNSPGEDMGNKLLYAMEHADRIFAGFVLSNNWKDLLAGRNRQTQRNYGKASSMVQPDGEPQRISSLICRKIQLL